MSSTDFRNKEDILDPQHWLHERYKQRMAAADLRVLLLNNDDSVIFKGQARQLTAEYIGAGIYEISKKPL